MKKISGIEKSLYDLLANKKYTIHYYQREYRWGKKQIEELISDLTDEFINYYSPKHPLPEVEKYGTYYLGSVIISSSENDHAIIDGQQRLTSITLLLIYLNNLQQDRDKKVKIDDLIFSERHFEKTFNIQVESRKQCLESLYKQQRYDLNGEDESVRTIFARYQELEEIFPEDLKGEALPYFIEWLIYKVYLVDITAYTEQDAHKIFVSMNDRGLSLTPTEMLKGYLLSEISSNEKRNNANDLWKQKILTLKDIGKEEDSDFLKNWLRAQYAETIRETKKGAENRDFDIIGTTFHKWVRDNHRKMGLRDSSDFEKFVLEEFNMFVDVYIRLKKYSEEFTEGFESIFYNSNRNFTLQYQIILAGISADDSTEVIDKKIKVISTFIDQFIAIRVFNFKVVDYSTIKNAVFNITKKIRRLKLSDLVHTLQNEINDMEHNLDNIDRFYLNQFTSRYMLHIISRMVYYIESESGIANRFEDYVSRRIKNPYDIEHIWADHYSRHGDEFKTEEEFQNFRNKFGGLLILPRDKNRSYNDNTYVDKLPMYFSENLLARSLNKKCYQNNPQFLNFFKNKSLPFIAHEIFNKNDIVIRQNLYSAICKQIWDVENISRVAR